MNLLTNGKISMASIENWFARKCDITGKGMNEGYYVEAQHKYISTEELMRKYVEDQGLDWETELATVGTDEEWFYWTQWEEIPDGDTDFYDSTGIVHRHCHKCNEITQVDDNFHFCNHCLTHL